MSWLAVPHNRVLAILAGDRSVTADMALFGRSKRTLLRRFLRLPGGILSHDTFSRVFRLLDTAVFEPCFARHAGQARARRAGRAYLLELLAAAQCACLGRSTSAH